MNAGCFFVFGNKGNTLVMATNAVAASDIPSLIGRLIKNMICLFDIVPEQTAMTSQKAFPLAWLTWRLCRGVFCASMHRRRRGRDRDSRGIF